jgi:hypothetical protein
MTTHKLRKLINMSTNDLMLTIESLEQTIQTAHENNSCEYFPLLDWYWELRYELDRRSN